MSRRDDTLRDAFLDEALAEDPAALEALEALVDELEPLAPPPPLRSAILAAAVSEGRFARFATTFAKLLDVTVEAARRILDTFEASPDWEDGPLPGTCASLWIAGGPATAGCIRGFIRLGAGMTFPDHGHLGDEAVLVLQGSFTDLTNGRESLPGDVVTMPAGSRHSFVATPGGPDLLYFVLLREGVELGGEIIRARD